MGFDYDKIQEKQEKEGNQWASYSDLFMVLSFVFLLLYVTASLRTGTHNVQNSIKYKELEKKAQDLESRVLAYNSLAEDTIARRESEKEQKTYQELLAKLDLLKEEANDEKRELRRRAKENENKERALNKYQQIIKGIIQANALAKHKVKRRDLIIKDKSQTIAEQTKTIDEQERDITNKTAIIAKREKEIAQKKKILAKKRVIIKNLNSDIARKRTAIASNKKKITSLDRELNKKIKRLRREQRKHKMSKKVLNRKIASLRKVTKKKIGSLRSKNYTISKKLKNVSGELKVINVELAQANKKIKKEIRERNKLASELEQTNRKNRRDIQNLRLAHQRKMKVEKEKFEADLAKQKLTAKQRAAKYKTFLANAERKQEAMNVKLAKLNRDIVKTEKKLVAVKSAKKKAERKVASLKTSNTRLSKDLSRAKANIEARNRIIKVIKENFRKEGTKVDIGKDGSVTLTLGDEYFSTGRADLKPAMKNALRKFMPIYAKSLLSDRKTAEKIQSVQVIGFASPTYRGRFVNPKSLKAEDRKAAQYNLDLSYKRAKAIFNYIFDQKKINYDYQKKLYELSGVTGRSFFGEDVPKDAIGMSEKTFCKKYNCEQSQKVIVKFNLKN